MTFYQSLVFCIHIFNDQRASVFSGGLGIACDDGAGHDAKYVTLDVRRRELPDGSTLLQHPYPLGECLLGVFYNVSAGS